MNLHVNKHRMKNESILNKQTKNKLKHNTKQLSTKICLNICNKIETIDSSTELTIADKHQRIHLHILVNECDVIVFAI